MRCMTVLGVAMVALLFAGCADEPSAVLSPAVSASTPAGPLLPFEAQTFESPELGISFECPREWRTEVDLSSFSSFGLASVKAISRLRDERQAGIKLLVKSRRIAEGGPPAPYLDAQLSDRAKLLESAEATGTRASDVRFVRLGGLRLLRYEGVAKIRWSEGFWPVFCLHSGRAHDTARPTEVIIEAGAPAEDWEAQRETLLAILESLRFSTPELSQ